MTTLSIRVAAAAVALAATFAAAPRVASAQTDADIQAEIDRLEVRIDSFQTGVELLVTLADGETDPLRAERVRALADGLQTEIDGLDAEVEELRGQLGGDDPVEPPADGELVSLAEMAALAVAAGIGLDDFDDTFFATNVTEYLSRTLTVQTGFFDFFRFDLLDPDRRAIIDADRLATAELLGVRIEL